MIELTNSVTARIPGKVLAFLLGHSLAIREAAHRLLFSVKQESPLRSAVLAVPDREFCLVGVCFNDCCKRLLTFFEPTPWSETASMQAQASSLISVEITFSHSSEPGLQFFPASLEFLVPRLQFNVIDLQFVEPLSSFFQ
jgi:hypothetical protein